MYVPQNTDVCNGQEHEAAAEINLLMLKLIPPLISLVCVLPEILHALVLSVPVSYFYLGEENDL